MLLDFCSRLIEKSENCEPPLLLRLRRRLGGEVETFGGGGGGGLGGVAGYSLFLVAGSAWLLELGTWNLWRLAVLPSHLPTG